ncbi:MAG TPA: type III secretion system inner membrane ring subunit SctD [Parachlamydiaceae bacterium]|nr:type III secretion system inner membrane ring subunit SctD [Parachlamydiaceae bacterium]
MPAKFVAEEGTLKGLELPLENGDSWIIGRDPDICQILIEDPSVSRRHILCKKSDLGITVENLSDSNKAFLNDQEILSPTLLQNSDFLRLGSSSYRFYADNEKDETLPESPPDEVVSEEGQEMPKEEEEEEDLAEAVQEEPLQNDHAVELEQEDSIFYESEEEDPEKALANINFDYADPGRFLLKVISGANNGAEFSMQTGHTYVVGKDPSAADIIFNDNSVSRQHVRLIIDEENKIFIEDLKSRNGTLVDGESLTEKKELESNALVTIGTTSFIIYDKESAMQTVISPLMPSIVKILQQKEEAKRLEAEAKERELTFAKEQAENAVKEAALEKKSTHNANAFILIAMITGLFTLAAIATTTLFREEPVVSEYSANIDNMLSTALSPFSNIKYNFNKTTGVLLLAGHVLTQTDKNQLLYNLQGLKFIKNLDDTGVVIDELAWREINPTLNKNPLWRSVSIQSPAPGKFILSGYLQTRKESEQLWDYVSNNFPYINLLEKKVVVEEDVISNVSSILLHEDFKDVTVQMSEGEITLTGFIPTNRQDSLNKVLTDIREIPGIRGVRSYVTELAGDQSMINLTDKYEVTGYSHQGRGNLSVIINGRILIRGDILDGMLITSIKPNAIFLEKDGIKYRIDYNK